MAAPRPRLSRDTRWLLIIVTVSLAALSALARVRFRNDASLSGPIVPVLSQLSPRSSFEEMSAAIDALQPRLRAVASAVALPSAMPEAPSREMHVPAVSFADGFVAVLVPERSRPGAAVQGFDRATRLAVVRVPDARVSPTLQTWTANAGSPPRFFVAVETPAGHVVARPVFVAALIAAASPGWPSPSWGLSGAPPLASGTLVFTLEGALVGMIAGRDGSQALVPWAVVAGEAERLLAVEASEAGYLDVEVQDMTAALQAATGAARGVVVSWVSPAGPAANVVQVGDVIVAADGRPLASVAEWQAHLDRLSAAQTVALDLSRDGASVRVNVVARRETPPVPLPLGLRLRTVTGAGARIDAVAAGSAGQRAGLRSGDLLTRVGEARVPTGAQARQAFDDAPGDRPILVAVTRGGEHFVLAMDRRW